MTGGVTVAPNKPSEPTATGSKRHRRPSVRLGEIGDQPNDSHPLRRTTTTTTTKSSWRLPFSNASGKHSKTRPLTNLTGFGGTLEDDDDVVRWKLKDSKKRGSSSSAAAKRPRSNWVASSQIEGEDFDAESPVLHSAENLGDDDDDDDDYRATLQHYHEENARDKNGNGGGVRHGEDWIRIWLKGLGLGRYAPVFEIHEVDDEVLHLLTLEDLKDMGINAVGSRRKLYCAIQKLGKGFS